MFTVKSCKKIPKKILEFYSAIFVQNSKIRLDFFNALKN